MQYAILGEIQFDLVSYFNGLEGKIAAEFAEHARLAQKPRLQFVGDKADEWTLTLQFHKSFCDPEKELAKLIKAVRAHAALAFVLASGEYKGYFVIPELSSVAKRTDTDGTLWAVNVTLQLKESGDPPKKDDSPKWAIIRGSTRPTGTATPPGAQNGWRIIPGGARPIPSGPIALVASAGRAVLSAGQIANQAVGVFRTASILAAQGAVGSAADRALAGLGAAASVLIGRGGVLAAPATEALNIAVATRPLFTGVNSGNHALRGAQAAAAMISVAGHMSTMAPEIARLTAAVATRSAA